MTFSTRIDEMTDTFVLYFCYISRKYDSKLFLHLQLFLVLHMRIIGTHEPIHIVNLQYCLNFYNLKSLSGGYLQKVLF